MHKILALYINELFKLSRKASTVIILILIVIACFLIPILTKIAQDKLYYEDTSYSDEGPSLTVQKTDSESRILEIESEINSLASAAPDDLYVVQLEAEKASLERQLETINIMLENNITGSEQDGFIYTAVSNLPSLRETLADLDAVNESDRTYDWADKRALCEEGIDLTYSLLKTKDFKAYVDFEKRANQTSLYFSTDETYTKILIEQYDLWYQLDPSGGTDGKYNYNDVDSALQQLGSLKYELYSGISYEETMNGTNITSLSPQKKADLEDQVAVLESRIKENSLVLPSKSPLASTAKSLIVSSGQFLITILLLVVAGSAVSQEIATGSIKSLIIAPVKRWKIFTAKLLSLFTLGVISLLLLWVFSNIGTAIIFGTDSMLPYVFVSGNSVVSMPYLVYDLLNLFAGNVSIIVYCTFAFMLSIITRNTALSVGLSIATLFTTNTAAAIISSLPIPHQLWMDFLPFMNFDLAGDLFPFSSFMQPLSEGMDTSGMILIHPGLQFSLIYLVVLVFCMLYISFDSFTRRDIK